MGDLIAMFGFNGEALVLFLIGIVLVVGAGWLLLVSPVPERYLEKVLAREQVAEEEDAFVVPVEQLRSAEISPEDQATFDSLMAKVDLVETVDVSSGRVLRVDTVAEDAELDPELLALQEEVVDTLRALGPVMPVDPPLVVWDRIEAAITRRPAASLDEEWSRVESAVQRGRADFGDAS